jgi:hypothetical protein
MMVAPAAARPGTPCGPREACVRTRREEEGSRYVDEDQGQDEPVAAEAMHDQW